MSDCNNNDESRCCSRSAYALAVFGALFIVAALVWAMKHYTTPPALGVARAAERSKNLAEIRAVESQELNHFGWVDQTKGQVRLTADRAMELTVAASQDPVAARKDLNTRVEKAFYVPPPPPEKQGAAE